MNLKNLELYFQHAPVADLTALAGIDTTGIVSGVVIEVTSAGFFRFQTPAVATPDGRDVITGNGGGVWIRLTLAQLTTNTGGAIDVSVGGTGKTTPQDAINELVGAPAAVRTFLRSDGVDVTMSAIEAGDLPILNQSTTGTASNVTGTVLLSNGGTGETSRQASLDALVGSVVDGTYLQGDGVNVVMGGIAAEDIPTLNQDTTGTAAKATNVAGGIANEIIYQTGADTTSFISPANNSVVISDGAGVPSMSSTIPTAVQDNITSVGTISSGEWNGTKISGYYGGTNWNNGSRIIKTGGHIITQGAFTLSGAYATTLTVTGTTAVTLPVAGTLATTSQLPTLPLPSSDGGTGINNDPHTITLAGSVSTGGGLTFSGAYSTTFTATDTTSVTLPTSGTLINDTELASQLTGYETVFNGVEDASLFSVSYSAATRIFTVTYSSGAAYTVGGVRYVPTPGIVTTSAHSTTDGQYYLYYDPSGVLTVSSTEWNFLTNATLASVYYNNSNDGGAAAGILQYEMHAGIGGMSNSTHLNLHSTRGTQLVNGCAASGYTLDAGGPSNVNWTTSAGSIADEDIVWPVVSQPLGGANTYRVLWLTGAEGSPTWNWKDVAQYGIYHDGTNIYYNQNNGGTYQLTAMTVNNSWVNYYILATTSYNGPQIIVVMGQNTYSSAIAADAATFGDDCSNFGLFSSEAVVLYQVTYRRGVAVGDPGNAEISNFEQVIQSLITSGVGGTIDAAGVTVSTGSFVNFFSPTDGNVQQCLDTLDANVPFSLAHGGTNANLTASNGGVFYSTAAEGAILSGTATANQALLSGSSTAPAWSTATFPATTTASQLLYSSATNTVAGLATGNDGTLITSAAGVPSISSTLPSAVQGNITSVGTIASGTWNGGIITGTYGGTGINNGASTITIGGNVSTGGGLTFSGAYSTTFTATDTTSVTLPTSGTLINDTELASQLTGYETVFNGIGGGMFAVDYTASTRVFDVTVIPDTTVTVGGVSYDVSSESTSAHADTSGIYYLYYNSSGVLTVSASHWNLLSTAPLAAVYYNTSNGGGAADGVLNFAQYPGGMSNIAHYNLHDTVGTKIRSGCVASGYTLDTAGAANINWATTSGIIEDQSVVLTVYAQALGGANTYRVLWLTGAEGSPAWNWIDTAQYGIYHNGTDIYYNQNNGGTYQLTAVAADNRWVNYYIVATVEEGQKQIIVVMGQTLYTDLATANAGTFATDCPNFDLFTDEAVILYRVTYRRDSGNGAPGNADIGSFTPIMQNLLDINYLGTVSASNIEVSTSSFGNVFDATDVNVQKSLNDLEALLGGTNNAVLATSAGGVPSLGTTLPSAVQGNITSVGTIASGTWNGDVVGGTYGGTGINNGASTITIAGNISTDEAFTLSGAYGTTLTVTAATALTLPTSGTLATTADIPTLPLSMANGGTNDNLTADKGGIFYSTDTAGAILAPSATYKTILMAGNPGTTLVPEWSSCAYPSDVNLNEVLVATANHSIGRVLIAPNAFLGRDGSSNTTSLTTLPSAVQANITEVGSITLGSWNGSVISGAKGGTGQANTGKTITVGGNLEFSGAYGTTLTVTDTTSVTLPTSGTLATTSEIPSFPLSMANGGTNANLTASNGGIFYSTASAGAVLSGTATANQVLLSGSSTTPAWSTATYPATTTINQLLYSSAANTVAGVTTANSGVVVTSSAGVPSVAGPMTDGQLLIGDSGGTPTVATVGTTDGITLGVGAGTLSIDIDKSGYYLTTACVYDSVAQVVRKGFNVSSVTYISAGLFRVNFTTSYADIYYPSGVDVYGGGSGLTIVTTGSRTASYVEMQTTISGTFTDIIWVSIIISNGT